MSNKKVVLDASAIIALIDQEQGWEQIAEVVSHSIVSSVNVAEVAKFLIDSKGYSKIEAKEIIEHIVDEVVNFSSEQAYLSAEIYSQTKKYGLSLGDRACIALAINTGFPAYTADRVWKDLDISFLVVKSIR